MLNAIKGNPYLVKDVCILIYIICQQICGCAYKEAVSSALWVEQSSLKCCHPLVDVQGHKVLSNCVGHHSPRNWAKRLVRVVDEHLKVRVKKVQSIWSCWDLAKWSMMELREKLKVYADFVRWQVSFGGPWLTYKIAVDNFETLQCLLAMLGIHNKIETVKKNFKKKLAKLCEIKWILWWKPFLLL